MGKFRLYRDVLPVCLAVDRRRGVPCPAQVKILFGLPGAG